MSLSRKHADYLSAIAPIPYRILGLRLKPFCRGHSSLLEQLGSPFVADPRAPSTKEQLLLALIICSCTWEQGRELLASPSSLKSEVARWERTICKRFRIFSRKLNLPEAKELFAQYLEDGNLRPKVWEYDGAPVALGAPAELSINAVLHLSFSDLMNTHTPLLWFQFYAAMEIKQSRKIIYDERDAENSRMAEEYERRMNESSRN